MINISCKICNCHMNFLFKKEQKYFGTALYYRCPSCGFVYSDHIERADIKQLSNFYKTCSFDLEDSGYLYRAKTALATLLKLIENTRLLKDKIYLLDYGCGKGSFLSYCLQNNINAFGYEPYHANNSINIYTSTEQLHASKDKFDIVTCFEVVEHLPNPDIFSSMLSLVRNNGYLLFSTGIFNEFAHNSSWEYFAPAHCSIYSVGSLEYLANKLSVKREYIVRHPFYKLPYVLTGEVWKKSGQSSNIFQTTEIEKSDRQYAKMKKLFRGFFHDMVCRSIYSKNSYYI